MLQKQLLQKNGIPQTDIDVLETAWNQWQSAQNQPPRNTPRIVCTGIYNAGKSTLLNVLCGEEQFPTGDIPTTKKVAQAEYDGAIYIDTPGLNAEDADDQETQSSYGDADFILFVSNAENGGISSAEADWLQTLQAGYSVETLRQRLVYVLTHSIQVEPDVLPKIQKQFRKDFEKAVGATLEHIFCVDSLTYLQGVKQNEPLLVEHSQIPNLQTHLQEKVANAEKLLAQAHAQELGARREELVRKLQRIAQTIQQKYDNIQKETQGKIQALTNEWKNFEKKLAKAMPSAKKIKPIFLYVSFDSPDYEFIQERSEGAAKRRCKAKIRPIYDQRRYKLEQRVDETMQGIREKYCSIGLDSVYAKTCNSINTVFEETTLSFQKFGFKISVETEIAVSPDLPYGFDNDIRNRLLKNAMSSDQFFSFDNYIDYYANIRYGTEYVFKRNKTKEVGMYTVWNLMGPVCEMAEKINDRLKSNAQLANSDLNHYWQKFRNELVTKVEKRKSELKQQVDSYMDTLKQTSMPKELSDGLAHLKELKKEVKA